MHTFENSVILVCVMIIASLTSLSYCSLKECFTEEQMRPLSTNCHIWESIREKKSLYIDKSRYLEYLTQRLFTFITRPHRFGKTTFIHMAEQFFMGNEALFRGLYVHEIGNTEWMLSRFLHRFPTLNESKWLEFPVIHLDFGGLVACTERMTEGSLLPHLMLIAEEFDIPFSELDDISTLIQKLSAKKELPVIILIDQYDSFYQHLVVNEYTDPLTVYHLMSFYNLFYKKVQNNAEYIGFTFVTGISRLPLECMGNGDNDFEDLTFDSRMATAFGITKDELETNLIYHVHEFAKHEALTFGKPVGDYDQNDVEEVFKELIESYYGYRFDYLCKAPKVFNPNSIISHLRQKTTFTFPPRAPSIPVLIIKEFYRDSESILKFKNGFNVSKDSLLQICDHSTSRIDLTTMLLSYGYLTIDDYDETAIMQEIRLKFSNKEAETAIEDCLANYDFHRDGYLYNTRVKELINLRQNLKYRCIKKAMAILQTFNLRSYNYSASHGELITEEMLKRLEIAFQFGDIEVELKRSFFNDSNSTDPTGCIDIVTLNLFANLLIKVECTKRNTSVTAIKQLIDNFNKDPNRFMNAQGNPKLCYLVGLHFELDENADIVLKDWAYLPCYKGKLLFQRMSFSRMKIKTDFQQIALDVLELYSKDTALQ